MKKNIELNTFLEVHAASIQETFDDLIDKRIKNHKASKKNKATIKNVWYSFRMIMDSETALKLIKSIHLKRYDDSSNARNYYLTAFTLLNQFGEIFNNEIEIYLKKYKTLISFQEYFDKDRIDVMIKNYLSLMPIYSLLVNRKNKQSNSRIKQKEFKQELFDKILKIKFDNSITDNRKALTILSEIDSELLEKAINVFYKKDLKQNTFESTLRAELKELSRESKSGIKIKGQIFKGKPIYSNDNIIEAKCRMLIQNNSFKVSLSNYKKNKTKK